MDYEKLIEQLRDENNCDVLDYIDDAATAIETLLAERETLMTQIRGECTHCKNREKCISELRTGQRTARECANNNHKNWEWRGPTEDGQNA